MRAPTRATPTLLALNTEVHSEYWARREKPDDKFNHSGQTEIQQYASSKYKKYAWSQTLGT